jgi:hypothetical protein
MATTPPNFTEVTENCALTPEPVFAFDPIGGPSGPASYVPPPICVGTFDLSTSECADLEADYVASLQAEALNIAAGPVNIFPMLGVHNQGSTADMTGSGYPLASGTPGGYNVLDAFNVNAASWRSIEVGTQVTAAPAFIGYSFGNKKAWEAVVTGGRDRYFPAAPVRKQVSSIKITQGALPENRARQVRIEASDDGVAWHRVDVVNLPNVPTAVTVGVRSNAAYNQWRLVPTMFAGGVADAWEVVELQLLESTSLSLDNIQDFFLLENRDRAYSRQSVMVKCQYDLMDVQTELAKFGINMPQTYIFTCSFAVLVNTLGRPVVVGDMIELPGEVQYDPNLRPVRKWLEVTDTAWATEGYAFNWKPLLFKFYAQPVLPSVEHRDILGTPGLVNGTQTDDDFLRNVMQNDQGHKASEFIKQTALDLVPQDGSDPANIRSGKPIIKPRGQYDGRDLYSEDALPPDGADFSFGDVIPNATTVPPGTYHRQTYTSIPQAIRPADRLLRSDGTRWRVVEVNTRATYESHKKSVSRAINGPDTMPPDAQL